jgi:hypothetical protein
VARLSENITSMENLTKSPNPLKYTNDANFYDDFSGSKSKKEETKLFSPEPF